MVRLLVLGLMVVLISCATPRSPAAPSKATPSPTPINGKLRIGDRSLSMICLGDGNPTVILDAGNGATAASWSQVQLAAMKITRVCAYDRANLGASDPAPLPRTLQDWTNDLERLLSASGLPEPYILVGHSYGGLNVRLYAVQHRQQVAGVILVDASHPDQNARFRAALPSASSSDSKDLVNFRRSLADNHILEPEQVRVAESMQQVRAAGTLDTIPLIVISRGQTEAAIDSKAINEALNQVWSDLQNDLLKLSTHSRQIIAEHSGHGVPQQQPTVIVQAIEDMVREVRAR
jgi:pimeloyl-ACP methyl ester carboxylesterase